MPTIPASPDPASRNRETPPREDQQHSQPAPDEPQPDPDPLHDRIRRDQKS